MRASEGERAALTRVRTEALRLRCPQVVDGLQVSPRGRTYRERYASVLMQVRDLAKERGAWELWAWAEEAHRRTLVLVGVERGKLTAEEAVEQLRALARMGAP